MSKFSHLKNLDAPTQTFWVELPRVSPGAAVEVRFVKTCRAYQHGVLRVAATLSEKERKGFQELKDKGVFEALDALRPIDLKLYAKHVLVGWRNIVDVDGNAVEFSPEVAEEFLAAIPDMEFDDIRIGANLPGNFPDESADDVDLEALSGNSEAASSGS